MTIRTRIRIGFLVLILTMLVALLYLSLSLGEFQEVTTLLGGEYLEAGQSTRQIEGTLDAHSDDVNYFLDRTGIPEGDQVLRRFKEDFRQDLIRFAPRLIYQVDQIDEELKKMQGKSLGGDFPSRVAALRGHLNGEYFRVLDMAISDFIRDEPGAGGMIRKLWNERLAALRGMLTSLEDVSLRESLNREFNRVEERYQRARVIAVGVALATLLISVLASIWIVRSISTRLKQLVHAHQEWKEENFEYRVDIGGDDELRELALSGNQMARRLSEVDDLKRDFISHVSHELKSPLHSMLSSTRLLRRELAGPINDKQRRQLTNILRTGDRLSRNIINLLDYSRIEAGIFSVNARPDDLRDLLCGFLGEVGPRLEEQHKLKRIIPDSPVPVCCDRTRIQQVLGNFIDNALKFSPPDSTVVVELEALAEGTQAPAQALGNLEAARSPCAVASVADAGPGVPEERRQAIFGKFQQEPSEHSRQGVGLGLAICRRIVEAHDGAIWVEDSRLGGSRFCLLLPMGEPKSPTIEESKRRRA